MVFLKETFEEVLEWSIVYRSSGFLGVSLMELDVERLVDDVWDSLCSFLEPEGFFSEII